MLSTLNSKSRLQWDIYFVCVCFIRTSKLHNVPTKDRLYFSHFFLFHCDWAMLNLVHIQQEIFKWKLCSSWRKGLWHQYITVAQQASEEYGCNPTRTLHYDVIKWKHLRVTIPLCRESTGHRWIPLTKGQQLGPLMFLCSQIWTSCRTNTRLTGNSRHHNDHWTSP